MKGKSILFLLMFLATAVSFSLAQTEQLVPTTREELLRERQAREDSLKRLTVSSQQATVTPTVTTIQPSNTVQSNQTQTVSTEKTAPKDENVFPVSQVEAFISHSNEFNNTDRTVMTRGQFVVRQPFGTRQRSMFGLGGYFSKGKGTYENYSADFLERVLFMSLAAATKRSGMSVFQLNLGLGENIEDGTGGTGAYRKKEKQRFFYADLYMDLTRKPGLYFSQFYFIATYKYPITSWSEIKSTYNGQDLNEKLPDRKSFYLQANLAILRFRLWDGITEGLSTTIGLTANYTDLSGKDNSFGGGIYSEFFYNYRKLGYISVGGKGKNFGKNKVSQTFEASVDVAQMFKMLF